MLSACVSFIIDSPHICARRELTDVILLRNYVHLRYIDVSKNALKDIAPLGALQHMLVLNASENQLETCELPHMPYLQVANFAQNHIASLEGVNHPLLEKLVLNGEFFPANMIEI